MAGRRTMKGRFVPANPQKYVGNVQNVVFRSAWERRMMRWLDTNNAVLRWSSEELAIPFVNPVLVDPFGRPKVSRYFPDFLVIYQDRTGAVHKEIIEVKPLRETKLVPGMSNLDKQTYAINQVKWRAASEYAQRNGATFRIITENSLFHQGVKRSKK